ncbi:MAG: squalene synthase HpnC [Xanthobacteraceae bacterium]|nr:squalene synthase HpnC [Xanthobacteraceae bacterium]
MTEAAAFRSGKGHRDENFPVASLLIGREHRAPILAFYEFVRTADDIADHPALPRTEKLAHLDALEADLLGRGDGRNDVALRLRAALEERKLTPRHAQDLLAAFRLDVTKLRYQNWDDLIGYCSLSAMPVGRFVLDVHGEPRTTWPANDALCAALQINNHLQDCRDDFCNLDRVYVPLDALAATGARVEELGAARSSPALLDCLQGLARRTRALLAESDGFQESIRDFRLSLEVAVIAAMARRIVGMLIVRDPLSENVRLGKLAMMQAVLVGIATGSLARMRRSVVPADASRQA